MIWRHQNPLTGSSAISGIEGWFLPEAEPDPMGINVGFEDPYITCCISPPAEEQPMPMLLVGYGVPNGRCVVDGMAIDCDWAMQMMEMGAAAQCPNNDCGPRSVVYQGQRTWAFFHAYADGYQGYVPANARYVGNGGVAPIGSGRAPTLGQVGNRPDGRNDTDLGRMNGANRPEQDLGRTPQFFGFGFTSGISPQKPNKTVIDLVNRTFENADCVDFLRAVLNSASTKSNPVMRGGDISDIFRDFLAQTKGGLSRDKVEGAKYGSVSGRIRADGSGNAVIYRGFAASGSQDWYDAKGIVAELPHLAGSKGGWPRPEYHDLDLARAAFDAGYNSYSRLKTVSNPFNTFPDRGSQERNRGSMIWSSYFHDIMNRFCDVPKG